MVLPAPGSAGNHDVEARGDCGLQQRQHGRGEGLIRQQVILGDGNVAETADGKMRAVDRQRRNDHVDAGSVGQTGVDHGRGFIHAASDGGNDLLDDAHQVRVILEAYLGLFQHSGALDVNPFGAVHQNVADGRVLQQRLKRAEPEHFVQDL